METICYTCRLFHPLRSLVRYSGRKSFECKQCYRAKQAHQPKRVAMWVSQVMWFCRHYLAPNDCGGDWDGGLVEFAADGWPPADDWTAAQLVTADEFAERVTIEQRHDAGVLTN